MWKSEYKPTKESAHNVAQHCCMKCCLQQMRRFNPKHERILYTCQLLLNICNTTHTSDNPAPSRSNIYTCGKMQQSDSTQSWCLMFRCQFSKTIQFKWGLTVYNNNIQKPFQLLGCIVTCSKHDPGQTVTMRISSSLTSGSKQIRMNTWGKSTHTKANFRHCIFLILCGSKFITKASEPSPPLDSLQKTIIKTAAGIPIRSFATQYEKAGNLGARSATAWCPLLRIVATVRFTAKNHH